jgi:predicted metal-dependent peptidase
MKYLKTFESINNDFRNKIFLIDTSASFEYDLIKAIDKVNFYLADKFTSIYCGGYFAVKSDMTLNELTVEVSKNVSGGGDNLQRGIDYIIQHKLEGPVLIFSDGYFSINIEGLENDISVLYTDTKPVIHGGECQLFKGDLESGHYYGPRDCKSMVEYEYRKASKKYNL